MSVFRQNNLADELPLGEEPWRFQLAGSAPSPVHLPAAWETHSADKLSDGPALYTREVFVPPEWLAAARSVVLQAEAVSYHTSVRVNGRLAGTHAGLWAPFQIDLTPYLQPGENELALEIWKPGERFPPRASLAGFLPDVCTTFGGPWQPLALRAFSHTYFEAVHFRAGPAGTLTVTGRLAQPAGAPAADLTLTLPADSGGPPAHARGRPEADGTFSLSLPAGAVPAWESHQTNRLSHAQLTAEAGGQSVAALRRPVGFRTIRAAAGGLAVNGRPAHLRGVLDWGWNPATVAPLWPDAPAAFAKARALGFNLWKCCLYVPDEAFLDAADAAGLPVWLEMPLWLPAVTPELKALALAEYEAVFQRLHHHPSLLILSLGCELNAAADAAFLSSLHALARHWLPDCLLCDNSGSAEAYAGVETELSDFYDYHFYTDPHFFAPLVQHFTRAYRPTKPWVYGEFCDADTGRDFSPVAAAWWLTERVALDRDEYRFQREQAARLRAAGVTDGGAALAAAGRRQATAIRQHILETVRREHATGGYVVTGWTDTPITTSGVVDDFGALKFEPAAWRRFNADVVLSLDRERRRRWEGGDRPSPKDPYVWWQTEPAELQVVLSNGAGGRPAESLTWVLTDDHDQTVAAGQALAPAVPGGQVQAVGVIRFAWPAAAAPAEYTLTARLGTVENVWHLWTVPPLTWPAALSVLPGGPAAAALAALAPSVSVTTFDPAAAEVLVADRLTPEVLAFVRAGGRALLWLLDPDPRCTRPRPFWREAIHVFPPHPTWEQVPAGAYADLRFFSVATDLALEPAACAGLLGTEVGPIWRRFDARELVWHAYAAEARLGAGRLILTTLRLAGGLGAQPVGLGANPMGAALLNTWLAGLSRR